MTEERTYRHLITPKKNLVPFNVVVQETDLSIYAKAVLDVLAKDLILQYRGYIENYISRYPGFQKTLVPWQINTPEAQIITDMAEAGQRSGVGPMAAVAGAMAEYVGKALLKSSDEIIVENGGDLFIKTDKPLTVGIYAGASPLSMKIGIIIKSDKNPVAVCTSSGTIGHSLSLGRADAVCVISESCSLADAAATSIGNHVKTKTDIQAAVEFGTSIEGVDGILIISGDEIGLWGNVELVPIGNQ
ncbi:MAG: UPF0280 family protein [Desulfobacterales bacterium]|nr:UPF0280 family protein [Desulfobacterales bacterium]